MSVYDYTLYDMIRRNALLHPNRDCMAYNHMRITHRDFKERCDRVAAGLFEAGIVRGDRIGVLAHNSDEFMILYGAAAKIGAVVVPVNWRFQPSEVTYVIEDTKPKFLFVGPQFQETGARLISDVSGIQKAFLLGGDEPGAPFIPFKSLYADRGLHTEFAVPAESAFVIIHTAAVEGRPRGAILSHRCILAGNLMMMYAYRLDSDDVHMAFLPLFHIAGLNVSLAVMQAGGMNVLMERFDPEMTLELIQREKGTLFFEFAPILKNLLDQYEKGSYDISSLRNVMGLDHPDTIRRFLDRAPHAVFWSMFGQTEALMVCQAPFTDKPGSAGVPCPWTRTALFDDYDNEVPTGAPGEICVRSPNVFSGYWGLDAETEYAFRNGWHHTGDVGRFDEDGYLWYVKRKAQKELIKPGGENVYPAEVEKVILLHEAVARACVIGVPDPHWGEAVKAVCVLKEDHTVEAADLIEFVASRIARYKKPKHVVFVDALPETSDGEIDREQVKQDHGGRY